MSSWTDRKARSYCVSSVGYRFGCPSVDSSIQLHGHRHSHGGRVSVVEKDEDVGAPLAMVNDDN